MSARIFGVTITNVANQKKTGEEKEIKYHLLCSIHYFVNGTFFSRYYYDSFWWINRENCLMNETRRFEFTFSSRRISHQFFFVVLFPWFSLLRWFNATSHSDSLCFSWIPKYSIKYCFTRAFVHARFSLHSFWNYINFPTKMESAPNHRNSLYTELHQWVRKTKKKWKKNGREMVKRIHKQTEMENKFQSIPLKKRQMLFKSIHFSVQLNAERRTNPRPTTRWRKQQQSDRKVMVKRNEMTVAKSFSVISFARIFLLFLSIGLGILCIRHFFKYASLKNTSDKYIYTYLYMCSLLDSYIFYKCTPRKSARQTSAQRMKREKKLKKRTFSFRSVFSCRVLLFFLWRNVCIYRKRLALAYTHTFYIRW